MKHNKHIPIITILVGAIFCFTFLYTTLSYGSDKAPVQDPSEVPAFLKFVDEYNKAEMARDRDKIWEMIAPSSLFKQKHSYEDFCRIFDESRIRLKKYVIYDGIVVVNGDKKNYPTIEKIGYVKIDLTFKEGEAEWTTTFILTFFKENGKWYKG
jgi:hypothetical protein